MTHYFSRLTLTSAGLENMVKNRAYGAYNIHKAIWGLFPNQADKERNFLYSVKDDGKLIYCISESIPVCNDGAWIVETKVYEPKISEGDCFRFYILANPTVANSKTGKHQRHDVVYNLKAKLKAEGQEFDNREVESEAVTDWFCRKGELNGFEPVLEPELSIHSYQRNESYKAGVHKIIFTTVVIEGYLHVTDREKFVSALYKGIGTAKGFGCGMLMIKRP